MQEGPTREEVEARLAQIEQRILHEDVWVTATRWFGFHIRWQRGWKRDGDMLRRRGTYGRFVYTEGDDPAGISRDELLERAQIPSTFRRLSADLKAMIFCSLCGGVGLGWEEKHQWAAIFYEEEKVNTRGFPERGMLWLCHSCIQELVQRAAARRTPPNSGG